MELPPPPSFLLLPLHAYNQPYELLYSNISDNSFLKTYGTCNNIHRAKTSATSSLQNTKLNEDVHPSMLFDYSLQMTSISPLPPNCNEIKFYSNLHPIDAHHSNYKQELHNVMQEKVKHKEDEEEIQLQLFDSYIATLFRNLSMNFNAFHKKIEDILQQKNKGDGTHTIEVVLRCYSFRFRDILIKSYNALVENGAPIYFRNEIQVLLEAIQLFDIFHILYICPLEDLSGNLLLWYKLFVGMKSNVLFTHKFNHLINKYLDKDTTISTDELGNYLCRLLLQGSAAEWVEAVCRLFPHNSKTIEFAEAVAIESVGMQVNTNNYCWRYESYSKSMETLRVIATKFEETTPLTDSHLLYKSVKLLMGDQSFIEVCSTDWMECFICTLYWAVSKLPLTINYHWEMIASTIVSKLHGASLNSVEYLIFTLFSSNDISKAINLLQYDQILYKELSTTASFLLPHVMNILFMNGTFTDVFKDAGAELHAAALIAYGRILKGIGLKDCSWYYYSVADSHPSARIEVIEEVNNCLMVEGGSLNECMHAVHFIENSNILTGQPAEKQLLILEALKRQAMKLSDSSDTILSAIKYALHFHVFCRKYMVPPTIRGASVINTILRKYSRRGLSGCNELIRIFSEHQNEIHQIERRVHSRIYNFYHTCAYIFPQLERLYEVVSLNNDKSEVLEWIEENQLQLRSCVYILFRMPEDIGWKSIDEGGTPLPLIPIIIEEACKLLEVVFKINCYSLISEQDRSALIYQWRCCLQRCNKECIVQNWGEEKKRRVEKAILLTTGRVANESQTHLLGDIYQVKQLVQKLTYGNINTTFYQPIY